MASNPYRTLTPLAMVILDLLSERPMHPYEMQQVFRERHTDQVVKVPAGSLYHTVERLSRTGLIDAVETGREGRRPERTVYKITESGLDQFQANLREVVQTPETEYPVFGMALAMLDALSPQEASHLVKRRGIQLEARLASFEQVIATLAKEGLPRVHTIEIEYLVAQCRAELAWTRQIVDDIKSGALVWGEKISPADVPGPPACDAAEQERSKDPVKEFRG